MTRIVQEKIQWMNKAQSEPIANWTQGIDIRPDHLRMNRGTLWDNHWLVPESQKEHAPLELGCHHLQQPSQSDHRLGRKTLGPDSTDGTKTESPKAWNDSAKHSADHSVDQRKKQHDPFISSCHQWRGDHVGSQSHVTNPSNCCQRLVKLEANI